MPRVTFLHRTGEGQTIVEHSGAHENLMELGRRNGVPGVVGDCGGFMSCATCHVHIPPHWRDVVGPASADERDLIEMTADPRPESRLGCQVWITPEMDGLEVRVAPA